MLKQLRTFHSEDMALTLILWLCSLPLIGLFVLPFFGLKTAAVAALLLFFVMMVVCWGICGWKVFKG